MSVSHVLPPSPPNTSHRNRIPPPVLSKAATSTPDDSPASNLPSSGTGTRKRVEFCSWTNILDAPSSDPPSELGSLKQLPRSKDCQSKVRSILKPFTESEVQALGLDGATDHQSSVTMDSVVEQLAVNDKISSLDAYQSLAQLVKAYDEIPEDTDTKSNVVAILKYIKRDLGIQVQNSATPLDMNLVTQALKLSVIFVWSEHLSPLLTDDFRIFITDKAINALAEHTAPKVIIVHYMHLLATQNFKTILFISGTRTVKLLEALRELPNHIQGKGTISERLLVYQKLIEQAKPIMKARTSLWVKEVLLGLASKVKEIQEKAISVGSRACVAFPQSSTLSQAAREALAESIKERTLSTALTQRLLGMIMAKEDAAQVPQIWALVMLMCNSIESKLTTWIHLKDWLKVLQRCFNSSDVNVRIQSFPAWNRFIYITKPHETSDAMLSMLAKPIVAQIERTSTSTSSKGTRSAAVSSYCMLLYYAFRPAASHKQYTRAWNEYIVKVATSKFLSKSSANADLCCRMLIALFWKDDTANRIWNENRAHDNTPTEPEELPSIDCKWIRSKAGAIVQVFRLLFLYSSWGPSIHGAEQAFVARAWRHFLKAIKESASKEIKASSETRKAVISIVEFLGDTNYDEISETYDTLPAHDISAHLRIACGMVVAELEPVAVLEALESTQRFVSPALLEYATTSALQGLSEDLDNLNEDLPPFAQRSMIVLNNELQKCCESNGEGVSSIPILEMTSRLVGQMSAGNAVPCLHVIEQSLASIINDKVGLHKLTSANEKYTTAWQTISHTCIDTLSELPITRLVSLDILLAAILTSSNGYSAGHKLNLYQAHFGSDNYVDLLGPLSQAAIEKLRSHAHDRAPGNNEEASSEDQSSLPVVQLQNNVALHEIMPESITKIPTSGPHTNKQVQGSALPPKPQHFNDLNENVSLRDKTDHRANRKPRHDDSQIEFVTVHSSPQNILEADSQTLTERQREVRERQRTEQAVTFADLRSSPSRRVHQTGRAASIDCEMARKAAALQDTPTTPTITRHIDDLDDEVLPSPTPKAKHKALRLIEIEVPSSPPSIVGDTANEVQIQDVPASPLLEATDDGAEMVTLEDEYEQPVHNDHSDHLSDNGLCSEVAETAEFKEAQGEQEIIINAGFVAGIANLDVHVFKDSAVAHPELEFTGEVLVAEQVLNSVLVSPIPEPDSDELDEASASQLSQDLDWHLMEASRANRVPDEEIQNIENGCRKRKSISDEPIATELPPLQKRRRSQRVLSSLQSSAVDIQMNQEVGEGYENEPKVNEDQTLEHHGDTNQRDDKSNSNGISDCERREWSTTPPRGRAVESPVPSYVEETEHTTQFHTPIPSQQHGPEDVIAAAATNNETTDLSTPKQNPNTIATPKVDIMTALQSVLEGLKNNKQAGIDLRMIDDLCFQIRFQAQENAQNRA